jgi:hypothetical protein
MSLEQRQPRMEDAVYLAYVRGLPCLICGYPRSDPAHLRSAARQYGKRQCGMGEKPDDRWVLPLCRHHHDEQHRHNELQWWASYGIPDPHALAIALYAARPNASRPKVERPRKSPTVHVRKPPEQRRKVGKGRPMESRSTFQPGRKIMNANRLRKPANH